MARGGVGPAVRRRAWLLYLLASTYLVARLVLNRLVTGQWGLDVELVAVTAGVAVAQLLILELAPGLLRPSREAGRGKAPRAEAGHE